MAITFIRPEGSLEPVDSSWVQGIAWGDLDGVLGLFVEFIEDSALIFYPNTPLKYYTNMKRAKSKGKWIWKTLYDIPYVIDPS